MLFLYMYMQIYMSNEVRERKEYGKKKQQNLGCVDFHGH